jgi:hypothetical protein
MKKRLITGQGEGIKKEDKKDGSDNIIFEFRGHNT